MAYCNQLFSAQWRFELFVTERLTGKPRSTDVNKIRRISIDHGLFVNFFRFKTWKMPIELQTMWLKELNFFQDLSEIRAVGILLVNLACKTSACVNIFWLRMNWIVKTITYSPTPFPRSASRNASLWVRIAKVGRCFWAPKPALGNVNMKICTHHCQQTCNNYPWLFHKIYLGSSASRNAVSWDLCDSMQYLNIS